MKILVTGGAGYIGSHTCIELVQNGYEIVVIDNLCNSSRESLNRVEQITGASIEFHKIDIRDLVQLRKIFLQDPIFAVFHFAGLKSVGESVEKPQKYYDNNVEGTYNLIRVMQEFSCKKIVFSSSATVYGDPHQVPIKENFPLSSTNPYGDSKLKIEKFLLETYNLDNSWNIAILRYFNPIGAHISGLIGEDPLNIPNNLLPYIAQVAIGKLEKVSVFGGNYNTHDGTGVRDYIHVVDLAKGHIKALEALKTNPGALVANLGTGIGYSVLEIISAFQLVSGRPVPYEIVARRAGDIPICYTDPNLAEKIFGWKARYTLHRMCEDLWRWQKMNPNGYNLG